MTPIEIAAKAYYEMQCPYGCPWEEVELEFRDKRIRLLLAAFTAFATTPPTESMEEACQNEMDNENLDCAWDVARAGILSAVNEVAAKARGEA